MKGRKVLLLDKERFPRDKTCGDAISGKSVGVLRELGLLEAVAKADHGEVTSLLFSSPNGLQITLPLKRKEGDIEKGYVCRRQVYDNLLFQNAKKKAEALEGAQVTAVVKENGLPAGVKARMADGSEKEFRARLIIGADGVGSTVNKEVPTHEVDPKHTCIAYRAYYSGITGLAGALEIHFVKSIMPGYFWIFPLENGLANVGVGMVMADMKARNINLQNAMGEIVAQNPLFKERFASAKMVSPMKAWSLPFGSKRRKFSAANMLLVGDAAGLVDPFSGEGVGNAMHSGRLAASVADEALSANDTTETFLARYDERLWEGVGHELETSYQMQKLGKHEWLLNFVVGKTARSEKARAAIQETFSSEDAKKGYASPLFYLKLLLS
jgi:geranylgeranyl reductase family protein